MSDEPLIYAPARRGNVGVLIMISGPSGSGKTKSALRLAIGLANGGKIGFCDTEHGRALYYADEFEFLHGELKEPFTPRRFEDAAVISQRAGHAVWVCDSFSHEHVGPGGVLDMFNDELTRMTRGDVSKQEALKYAAWIKPKMEHKHLLQRLWQLNAHIILCCHAEKKLDLIKDKRGKMVPNPEGGLSPVCSPDIPYAMTCSFMLDTKRPGVPSWLKHLDKLDAMVDLDKPLDEATGARIAAWARGDKVEPRTQSTTNPATSRPDVDISPLNSGSVDNEAYQQPGPNGDDPEDVRLADDVVDIFNGSVDLKEHFALVDANQEQFLWLKRQAPRLWRDKVGPAVKASAERHGFEARPKPTEQQPAVEATPENAPVDLLNRLASEDAL